MPSASTRSAQSVSGCAPSAMSVFVPAAAALRVATPEPRAPGGRSERVLGGDAGAAGERGLHHDDHVGERGDDPVADREAARRGPDAVAGLAEYETLVAAPGGTAPTWRRGYSTSRPVATTPIVRPPPSMAPWCAAPSIPMARPLITVIPDGRERGRASSRASASPCGVAARADDGDARRVERVGSIALGDQDRGRLRDRVEDRVGRLVPQPDPAPAVVQLSPGAFPVDPARPGGEASVLTPRRSGARIVESSHRAPVPRSTAVSATCGSCRSGRGGAAAAAVSSPRCRRARRAATWSSLGGRHELDASDPPALTARPHGASRPATRARPRRRSRVEVGERARNTPDPGRTAAR